MDLDHVSLENDSLSLQVARAFGPRIVSLKYKGGTNLLAELPDFVTRRPDGESYHFYGGHRLWLAPEDSLRSYALDDLPVEIARKGNSLLLRKEVEHETGIEKSMQLALSSSEAKCTLTHRLTNLGSTPVECAAWAITQLRLGGVAILPQVSTRNELLPNRLLVLWPYTNISSRHVIWGNRFIRVHAQVQPPFKIGFPNPHTWLGYWLEGTLLVKQAAYEVQAHYPDFGCSSECYCNDRFLELETLAPISMLAPGASAVHVETWSLYGNVDFPKDEDSIQATLDKIGME